MTGQQTALDVGARLRLTRPGIYHITQEQYFADPVKGGSLSSTGARKLLDPSTPAEFRYWADHPEQHTSTFDFGQAAHAELLGIGREIRVIDRDNYKTKAAQEEKAAAYADGEIPMLTAEMQVVEDMMFALRDHPIAGPLFDPGAGTPEQTIIWRDARTKVARRAMLDWLPDRADGQRLIVPDYKTTARKVDDDTLSKAMWDHGYYQQAAWYLDAVQAAGLTGGLEAAFLLVFQSKTAPYLVNVKQVDPHALMWGDERNRQALTTYAHCTRTGHWPGYERVTSLDLPAFAVRRLEDERDANSTHQETAA